MDKFNLIVIAQFKYSTTSFPLDADQFVKVRTSESICDKGEEIQTPPRLHQTHFTHQSRLGRVALISTSHVFLQTWHIEAEIVFLHQFLFFSVFCLSVSD